MNMNNTGPWASSDPSAKTAGRDERFLRTTEQVDPGSFDIGPGLNTLYVLPSCSDYSAYIPARISEYKLGHFYSRIAIQTKGLKRKRTLRVQNGNDLTRAFWKIYEAIGNTPEFKALKEGFDAGLDHRAVLNVVVLRNGQISPVRWFDVGAENPTKKGTRERLLTMIQTRLQTIYKETSQFPFLTESAGQLGLQVAYNGGFPQYTYVQESRDMGKLQVHDLRAAIPGYDPAKLDEAREWAAGFDELPSLEEIPVIAQNGKFCTILGISTDQAQASASQVPVGAGPFGAQAPAAAAQHPAMAAASQPRPPAFPPGYGPTAAAPVAPQAPVAQVAPVAPPAAGPVTVPAGFGQGGAVTLPPAQPFTGVAPDAASVFAAKLQAERAAKGDQPPF